MKPLVDWASNVAGVSEDDANRANPAVDRVAELAPASTSAPTALRPTSLKRKTGPPVQEAISAEQACAREAWRVARGCRYAYKHAGIQKTDIPVARAAPREVRRVSPDLDL